jgi:hypothetical protein
MGGKIKLPAPKKKENNIKAMGNTKLNEKLSFVINAPI